MGHRKRTSPLAELRWRFASAFFSIVHRSKPVRRAYWSVRELFQLELRPRLLRFRARHVHGPRRIERARDELLVASVVRDGELYVGSFLDHYRRLGVRHFVFLDNGSTDRTVELLSGHDGVTVLRSSVPYRAYENAMKTYLVRRFSTGRWVLFADVDELFDYPFSYRLGLRDLLRYLEAHRYRAVVAQMLDMFSERPLAEPPSDLGDDLRSRYPLYDLSDVRKSPYPSRYSRGRLANPSIEFHSHGVRARWFGTANGLTKTCLFFVDDEIVPFTGWHHTKGARLADFTGALLHFPFVPSFREKVRDEVASGRYGYYVTGEYRRYWDVIADGRTRLDPPPTAQRLDDLAALVDQGFLVVSDEYRSWVERYGTRGDSALGAQRSSARPRRRPFPVGEPTR